jgi:hypothetical protein
MRKIVFLAITIPFFLIFSCNDGLTTGEKSYEKSKIPVTSIYDERLNGSFSYYSSWETSYSRKYIYETYRFDGTDRVKNHYEMGYTSGYDTSKYDFDYEFEFDSGKYRKKLYHNQYSNWGIGKHFVLVSMEIIC